MPSRFGNFDLLRQLHSLVKFDKQGTGPTEFSDQAVATADLGAAGFNGYTGPTLGAVAGTALGGTSSLNSMLVGKRLGSSATELITSNAQESRVLAVNATLVYDAAGAAAAAAAFHRVNLRLALVPKTVASDSTAGVYVGNLSPWVMPHSTRTVYEFALGFFRTQGVVESVDPVRESYALQPAPWNGWVPADWFLRFELATFGAVNFPANTTIDINIAAVQFPKGCRLPW